MYYEYFMTNDDTQIAFQTTLPIRSSTTTKSTTTTQVQPQANANHARLPESATTNPLAETCILLIHGFSGSSNYFIHNFVTLSSRSWVIALDMRGHGNSDTTQGGFHVARLAADLANLLGLIRSVRPGVHIYPVGCSIGAAVLWTYLEVFSNNNFEPEMVSGELFAVRRSQIKTFSGFIFVDQAPLQDRTSFDDWNESKAHYVLYDERTLLEAQAAWASPYASIRAEAHRDLVRSCLGYRVRSDTSRPAPTQEQQDIDEKFFTTISARCDGVWLAKLMADHTRYDHRESLEHIDVPVLVMAGARSGCFPLDGMLETVKRVNHGGKRTLAEASVFDCGHWLFYEEPERFNREVLEFVQKCESRLGQIVKQA